MRDDMVCSTCGHENREGARFCGECGGAMLTRVPCPACGQPNWVEARFCDACGHRLEPPPATPRVGDSGGPEAERKQVTVLFCDVQESMRLAGGLDAETWRSVMGRFFDLFRAEVEGVDGTVDKFTGDGAMAIFGAPVALEDHAARACHASLALRDRLDGLSEEIQTAHGARFAVRMGLNSGEVVVGAVGSGEPGYTAIGNTVGLAARMESCAEPGRPCLTSTTATLVEGLFELEDRGVLVVKGVEAPVRSFALVGSRASSVRLEALRGQGWSRFVGRDAELELLEAALRRTHTSGQAVGVVAEPGLGKSRLCREFVRRCRDRGIDVTEGRGVAHGTRVPLLPVIEMLRSWLEIEEADTPEAAQRKIGTRLLELDARFAEALPVLYEFLGVGSAELAAPQMSPEARQRALLGVVRRLTEARAAAGPAVLLIEDLHWLDPGSEAFLEALVDSLPGSRTLLLLNFRPEYRAAWTSKSYYEQLPLPPLPGDAVTEMLAASVGGHPSVDALAELLTARTGGNPFFVEEVVQAMIERGTLEGEPGAYRLTRSIESIEIPASVHGVLAARIDRLSQRDKAVLTSASVIGRRFSEAVLRVVAGLPEDELEAALRALRAAELVYETSSYPEPEYAFKHALTEEVAYSAQLSERRVRLHAAVAEAIESVHSDRLEELAAVVATHWDGAGEPLAAARWSVRAAKWAGQHHPAEALRHWEQVSSLLRDAPSSDEGDGLRMAACLWILSFGWRLGRAPEEIDAVQAEGIALAGAAGQRPALAAVLSAAAIATVFSRGDVPAAVALAREAERVGTEVGVTELRIAGGLHFLLAVSGDLVAGLAKLEEMSTLIEREPEPYAVGRATVGFSTLVWNTFFRGQLLCHLGRLDEAREQLVRAVALAEEHDDPESLGWALNDLGSLDYYSGVSGEGITYVLRSLELADKLGSSLQRIVALNSVAIARLGRGEAEEAIAALTELLDDVERAGTSRVYKAYYLSNLAEALLAAGDHEAARVRAAEGVAEGRRNGTRVFEARSQWILGRALLALGDHSGAERELRASLEALERLAPGFVPPVHEALADLAASLGDPEEERRRLERAHQLYTDHGATGRAQSVAERLERTRVSSA